MGPSDAGESEQQPTSDERQRLAERELGNAGEQTRARVQENYRLGRPETGPGLGATASGTMFGLTGSGGGYNLNPDELAAHIKRFEALADRIANQTARWKQAAFHANPPSGDPPALRQAKATRRSCEIGMDSNQAKLRRATEFIDAMKRAHGGYQVMEDDTADTMRTSDSGAERGTGGLYKNDRSEPRPNTGSLYDQRDGQ